MKENPGIIYQTDINKHEQVRFTQGLQGRVYVKKKSITITPNINKLVKRCWMFSIEAKRNI